MQRQEPYKLGTLAADISPGFGQEKNDDQPGIVVCQTLMHYNVQDGLYSKKDVESQKF